MKKENAVTRTLSRQSTKRDTDVWVEGRWIFYSPTFFPAHEPKEWGGRYDRKLGAYRLPRLTEIALKIRAYDDKACFSGDAKNWLRTEKEWEENDDAVFGSVVDTEHLPEAFDRLYPFQRVATHAMLARPLHGELLALSPGLGKTPTSIVAADLF